MQYTYIYISDELNIVEIFFFFYIFDKFKVCDILDIFKVCDTLDIFNIFDTFDILNILIYF